MCKYFIIINLFFLFSCETNIKNKKECDANAIYISIKDYIKKEEKVYLSSYNENIKYIPLETTEESLISKIEKLIITEDYIFVSDFYNLFAFNKRGEFVKKISRRGNSYNEYTYVSDILYNDISKSLYLITGRKIILFDSNLNYYGYINVDFGPFYAISYQANSLFFYIGETLNFENNNNNLYNIIETDTLGNVINKYINHSPRIRKEEIGGYLSVSKRPLYIHNNKILFNEFGNDTLVIVDNGEYTPVAIFDLGNYKMDHTICMKLEEQSRIMDDLKRKVFIQDIFEDDKLLYIVLSWGFGEDIFDYIIYDKNTNRIMNLGPNKLYNDIDGGVSFFPKYISNNKKIDWIDAEEFKNHVSLNYNELFMNKYGEKYEYIYNLGQSLSFDDNPIVIISE
jgi:hypothetical protein